MKYRKSTCLFLMLIICSCAIANAAPPPFPSNLSATAVSSSQINLTWTDNATNEKGFNIERALSSSGPWSQIASVDSNVTTYQNTGLSAFTTFYYRVCSFNSAGSSSFSDVASATTFATIPGAPSGLSATTISSSQINLSWSDNSINETGFKIERALSSGGPWSQIATVGANVIVYTNTGLTGCTDYYYRVCAYNSAGNSTYTGVTAFTMPSGTTSDKIRCLVRQYYLDILDREPDAGGWDYWAGEIARIMNLGIYVGEGFQAEARFFFNSQEYLNKNKTDTEFVTDLYQVFFQRDPDAAGLTYWSSELNCLTRNMLISNFAYSNEFKIYMSNIFGADTTRPENNLVNDFYRGFLNRFPDNSGFNAYLLQMRQAQCSGATAIINLSYQISLSFIQSSEYAARNRNNAGYVEDLYNGILRRGGDCAGFTELVNDLDSGTSRADTLKLFTESTEFQTRANTVAAAGCILTTTTTSIRPTTTTSQPTTTTSIRPTTTTTSVLSTTTTSIRPTTTTTSVRPTTTTSVQPTTSTSSIRPTTTTSVSTTSTSVPPTTSTTTSIITDPTAPSNLTATAISTSQINLSWTDNSSNEVNFHIERSLGQTWSEITTVGANVTTYSNTGLSASTTYNYRVRMSYKQGSKTKYSDYSNVAIATTKSISTTSLPVTTSIMPTTTTTSIRPTTTTTLQSTTTTTSIRPTTTTTSIRPTTTTTTTPSPSPELIGFTPGLGSPLDVTLSGGNAFLASAVFGLSVADVSNPADPSVLSASDIPFYGDKIAVSATRAVVTGQTADGKAHLWVLEWVQPEAPYVVGELSTTITVDTFSGFKDVALNISGTMAVVAAGTQGIWVIDLRMPSSPAVYRTYDTPGIAYAVTLNTAGTLAYVADGSSGLKILSVSLSASPTLVGSLSLSGHILRDISITGGVACLANQQGTLDVVDVSISSAPRFVGSAALTGLSFHVAAYGTRAAVISYTSTADWLEIFNIADPAHPTRIGSAVAIGGLPNSAQGIAMDDTHTYIADSVEGLKIFSSGPIVLNDTFVGHSIAVNQSRSLVVAVGQYKPDNTARLQVLSGSCLLVGELSTTITVDTFSGFKDVALNSTGTMAVVAAGTQGIWVVDLRTPSSPTVYRTYDTPGIAYAVALNSTGTLAYVADGSSGLKILSVSLSASPALVGSLSLSGHILRDIAVTGWVACLANQQGTLDVVDVSISSAPRFVGSAALTGLSFHVAAYGTRAAVISYTSTADWLEIFNIADPARPTRIGLAVAIGGLANSAQGIAMDDTHSYVADSDEGLKIFDMDAFAFASYSPVMIPGAAYDVTIMNSYAYVTGYPCAASMIDFVAQ